MELNRALLTEREAVHPPAPSTHTHCQPFLGFLGGKNKISVGEILALCVPGDKDKNVHSSIICNNKQTRKQKHLNHYHSMPTDREMDEYLCYSHTMEFYAREEYE